VPPMGVPSINACKEGGQAFSDARARVDGTISASPKIRLNVRQLMMNRKRFDETGMYSSSLRDECVRLDMK
jgi:hypothetical protein